MKTATVVQHVAFEDLGSFADVLHARGFEVKHLLAGRDSFTTATFGDPDLAVVLGGPISVNDTASYPFLESEIEFLKRRLDAQRPCLGICLGAQLIALTLGATVKPMGHKEIGFSRLTLSPSGCKSVLACLADQPVLHWHGERFALPTGTTSLASTALCDNQAFALGNYALALQFHPEATARGLEQWYVAHCAELAQARVSVPDLRIQAARSAENLVPTAQQLFNTWLSNCGL